MLAYDYPLLGLFWTLLWFYILVMWFVILFHVIVDIFRNHDMGGFSKAIWLIFVFFVPILGVLVYVLAHGDDMSARRMADAQAQDQAFRTYVQETAASASPAEQLTQLAALRDQGTITEAEFETGKAKILA